MPYTMPRVQLLPLPDDQVSFEIDGRERLRWHGSAREPRPCFFPVVGPAGKSLTRLNHPDDPVNHDHHRSLWFGHQQFAGMNAWEFRPGKMGTPSIRQEARLHLQDGDFGGLVVRLGWYDGQNTKLMQHDLTATLRPLHQGETLLELQSQFTTPLPELALGKTNFGFLGVRVIPSVSERYGGGTLTNSDGLTGEKATFAKPALWVDYSGPVTPHAVEGLTLFDHPSNPRHPTPWHVRADGWFCPAFFLTDGLTLRPNEPLKLRYALHVHRGACDPARAAQQFAAFAATPPWDLAKGEPPWRLRLTRRA